MPSSHRSQHFDTSHATRQTPPIPPTITSKRRTKGSLRGGQAASTSSLASSLCATTSFDSSSDGLMGPKGLKNIGNSCYANATLQCLLNTALPHALTDPKACAVFRRYSSNPNILAQGSGSVDSEDDCCTTTTETTVASSVVRRRRLIRERQRHDQARLLEHCQWLTAELRTLTQDYWKPTQPPSYWAPAPLVIDPGSITRQPQRLCTSLRPYQQEDAHEFLRALLSTLVLHGHNKELSSLFDGLLESAVTCQRCLRPSLTRDRYMDLSLDISEPHITTLTDALSEFTHTELLQGDNAVYCNRCESKQAATKGLRLATAPSILVCHLKRFAFDNYGRLHRLQKRVTFPSTLEIGPYMSRVNRARPPKYALVAVLVHQGTSCDCGHYLAYVQHHGKWYKCNDSLIEQVPEHVVLAQQAYIVLYEVAGMRETTRAASVAQKVPPAAAHEPTPDLSSLLCGGDGPLWELCHGWTTTSTTPSRRRTRPKRPRRPPQQRDQSRDDLSTLGSSSIGGESANNGGRFYRSASSVQLRSHRQRASSVARNNSEQQHRDPPRSSSVARRSARRMPDLPPRPSHRRIISGG